MQTNSNLSCIPFYENLEEQDFRKWYAYGDKYINRVPNDYLLPFFFPLPPTTASREWELLSAQLFRLCCDEEEVAYNASYDMGAFSNAFAVTELPVEGLLVLNGLKITRSGTKSVCTYLADTSTPQSSFHLPRGLYYLHLKFATQGESTRYYEVYSDVFLAESREDIARHVKVEWYSMENQAYEGGVIPYEEHEGNVYYKNVLYLDTEIGMPEYTFTEEGEERNGYFFPTKQISEKVFSMKFVAPEYLCDVMRLIRMSDVVKITDGIGRTYGVEQFEMEVEWLEQGHYAEVSCTFQTDTVVKKIGKAYTNITDR